MLEARNVRAGYGDIPVLFGLSLDIRDGEFVGVLGHNGMGKTTLLKTLIGVLPATSGEILFEGSSIVRTPPHQRARMGVGYVPQGRGILPGLTAHDNLRFAAAAVGRNKHSIDQVLEEFPRLKSLLGRPGGALSGGEQQLLALARALVQEPRIVLLDEPTEGIQPSVVEEIGDQLKALKKERGLTVLLVEQNLDFITHLSDRILILENGLITKALDADAAGEWAGIGAFDR